MPVDNATQGGRKVKKINGDEDELRMSIHDMN